MSLDNLAESISRLDHTKSAMPVKFVYNGEPDFMETYKDCSLEFDNDGNPYVLLDDKRKS
jgi:hypothetical protein